MHDVDLDISHSDLLHLGDEEQRPPHVLILPSKLKQFEKVRVYIYYLMDDIDKF